MRSTSLGPLPLAGKVAMITGANQGFGLEVARRYVLSGASVSLCARDGGLQAQAADELRLLAGNGQRVLAAAADVSRKEDVDSVVRSTLHTLGQIDVLINNAGVYGPKGATEEVDWEEWVRAIETNLYGSVLMCRAVLPHFKARRGGKIIQLSGGGATNPLPRLSAYAASKAAIVRFVETLSEEVKDDNIDVNAIAPGALNTRMLEEVLQAGPEQVGAAFHARALEQKKSGGARLEQGAALAVFLGSAQSDGITGRLISAVWDAWESLPDHLDDLTGSDIYTLRRIVPEDRGRNWGHGR